MAASEVSSSRVSNADVRAAAEVTAARADVRVCDGVRHCTFTHRV